LRICAYLPIYKRKGLVVETLYRLKSQTQALDRIVAVGSCQEDKETAEQCGVDYISFSNQPLSTKIQQAVIYLRRFKPDGIMGIGSDDWPTANWVEELSPYLEKFDVVGTDRLYFCRHGSRPVELIQYRYPPPRYGEPMGVGRLVSRRILDKLKWRLYPGGLRHGLDGASHRRMMLVKAKTFLYKADVAKILCPKGLPNQLTTWVHGVRPDHGKKIQDDTWLQTNFPGLEEKGLI